MDPMSGNLQNIFLCRRFGNAQLSMDIESTRRCSVLDDVVDAVWSGAGGVVDCPGCRFDIVVNSWYVVDRAIRGCIDWDIQLFTRTVGSCGKIGRGSGSSMIQKKQDARSNDGGHCTILYQ